MQGKSFFFNRDCSLFQIAELKTDTKSQVNSNSYVDSITYRISQSWLNVDYIGGGFMGGGGRGLNIGLNKGGGFFHGQAFTKDA